MNSPPAHDWLFSLGTEHSREKSPASNTYSTKHHDSNTTQTIISNSQSHTHPPVLRTHHQQRELCERAEGNTLAALTVDRLRLLLKHGVQILLKHTQLHILFSVYETWILPIYTGFLFRTCVYWHVRLSLTVHLHSADVSGDDPHLENTSDWHGHHCVLWNTHTHVCFTILLRTLHELPLILYIG